MSQSDAGSMSEIEVRERFYTKYPAAIGNARAMRELFEDVVRLAPAERAIALDALRQGMLAVMHNADTQASVALAFKHPEALLPFQRLFATMAGAGVDALEEFAQPFAPTQTEVHAFRAPTPEQIAARQLSLHDELLKIAAAVKAGHVAGLVLASVDTKDAPKNDIADRLFLGGTGTSEDRAVILDALYSTVDELFNEIDAIERGEAPAAGMPS